MSNRTLVSRLRRKGVMIVLPLAAAVLPLAFAPTAAADQIYTPANSAALTADITAANAAGGFNIIELQGSATSGGYVPTTPIVITGHLEITGPPKANYLPSNKFVVVGDDVSPLATSDTITVASGANVILKGFTLQLCGSQEDPSVQTACVRVDGGGNLELDNMSIANPVNDGVIVNAGGSATLNNAEVFDSGAEGIVVNDPGTLTLNNATIADNGADGLLWSPGADVTINNSIIALSNHLDAGYQNCSVGSPGPVPLSDVTTIASIDDDGTCDVEPAFSDDQNIDLSSTTEDGQGPSLFLATGLDNGFSDAWGAGDPLTCQNDDQTFYLRTGGQNSFPAGACDDGAWQSTAVDGGAGSTQDASTTGPVCTVPATVNGNPNPFESTSATVPSTEQVNVQSVSPAGLAADAIFDPVSVLKASPTTPNGTVGWPVIPGTLFDETNPTGAPVYTGAGGAQEQLDAPSSALFPVTAQKPLGDLTSGDTSWQFDASDWLGNTTLCK